MTTPVFEATGSKIPVKKNASTRKRPADYTGKLTEHLNEEKMAEKLEASQRIAMITQEQAIAKDEVVDYSDSDEPVSEVEIRQAEVNTPFRMIRVNTDIPQMTYGRKVVDPGDYDNPDLTKRRPAIMGPMNMYSFKEGQLYRVPKELADHLYNIGYLSYISGA